MAGPDTIKLRYIGKHTDGVVIAPPGGDEIEVAHGATVELAAGDFAAGLLAQPANWQPVGAAAKEVAGTMRAAAPAEGDTGG